MLSEVSRLLCQAGSGWHTAALLGVLLCLSPNAEALKVNSNVGVDLRYTDNATLASANKKSDTITIGTISAAVTEDQGPVTGSVNASFRYLDYLDKTFDEQTYLRLGGSARWEQIRNVLSWNFNDFYTQAQVNNLAGNTPSNTEDINVANLDGHLTLRLADRHTLSLAPTYRDYYYQTSGNDNHQTGITAGWSYRIRPTVSMSLTGGYRQVVYDNDLLNSDYTSTKLDIGVRVKRLRSDYSAAIGATKASRDSGADTSGITAKLGANYKFTERSSVNVSVSRDITDTSAIYLDSSLDPNTGDYGNVQTSNDVVTNSIARAAYNRTGTVTVFSTWIELRKLDYQTTANDRKIREIGASLSRRLLPGVSALIGGSYVETDLESVTSTDTHYQANAQLGYSLSRKLNATAGARYQNRDTGSTSGGYDELGVFARLGYRLSP